MTAQEHIERIRAAVNQYRLAMSGSDWSDARIAFDEACNPLTMSSVLAHIDQQQAEIERLQTCVNDWLYANGPDGWIDRLRKEADRAQPERPAPAKPIEDCLCGKCRLGKISDMGLIRCEKCGAHACPHAMDHEVPCPVYDTAAPSQPERKPISEDKA
jgi:hypothetical protein